MRDLYRPDKYEVVLGEGKNCALATCWTDPFRLTESVPKVREHFALIGSLYGKEGVSVMLRNLCLNPDIRYLFVLSDGKLSQTAFGSLGWRTLVALWENGIDEECRVRRQGSQLHHELDPATVRTVIKNVELRELTRAELESMTMKQYTTQGAYMEPQAFPEPERDALQMFPSEEVGFLVRGDTILEAWLEVVRRIIRYGHIKGTEYGNQQRELHLVTWVVDQKADELQIPDWPEETLRLAGIDAASIDEYRKALLNPEVPEGTTYTYGQRLRAYNGEVDQIGGIIRKLKENPLSRRAFATPFYPISDLKQKYPPCLVQIHVLTNGHKVNLLATFRSHDIFKAAIANAYGLLGLQEYIVEETGLEMGKLAITSNSAHIYEEEWLPAAQLVGTETAHGFRPDPRGSIRIFVDTKIKVELVSDDKTIYEAEGSDAYALAKDIAQQDLLLHPEHYVDITNELLKAQIALEEGRRYVQDKTVEISGIRFR